VIVKAEHNRGGSNPRFLVTSIAGGAGPLYCARGEAENRIEEQQLDLFSDPTSFMNWLPNQLRVLLTAVTYALMEAQRRLRRHGTHMANVHCLFIRLKLLKIGAVISRNTRRVWLMLSSACPHQQLFMTFCDTLEANIEPIAADNILIL
jgi:hypothetical protein